MFSYIFMKILEKRPERYDTGIKILSAGHAQKMRKQIIQRFVKPHMDILDIGCGTGSLLIDVAKSGANATGVDISHAMLTIAKRRIADRGLKDRIALHNVGVVEIASLFEENRFDLIVSTLVFSELYAEERALALHQIRKLLKPDGTFVIAVEVQPKNPLKRLIHFLVRFPLSVLTYIIAQTGTKPCNRIIEEIRLAGLHIISENRSFLESFIIITARKPVGGSSDHIVLPGMMEAKDDRSLFKVIWDFIGRWFPNPVEPGLRVMGHPHRKSPVILTSNFHLTVRRVEKALQGTDAFLLVVPANGINVWCGSCGGDLNTNSVITAIKTSRINERVDHHQIFLPQFSAPGIDRGLLKKETGRTGIFGPAYAKDIPMFLKNRKTVLEHNRAEFSLPFRLEMLFSMNFLVWTLIGIFALIIKPGSFFPLSLYFWLTGFLLYAGFPVIPGKSGWLKATALSLMEVIAIALYSVFVLHMSILIYWQMMILISAINIWLGFDLTGIVAGNPSEAEWLMHKLGMSSFGHIFAADVFSPGKIQQDINKCNNCRVCFMICPKGVFGIEDGNNIRVQKKWECFACNACVTQCPEEALWLKEKKGNTTLTIRST
jgi:ubiquinone/menaquinone biosynthesis C-methylase UbiE/NAD-dependent dihydropyrimidine dehydrogenase PreA subunit